MFACLLITAAIVGCGTHVFADLYFHTPRGSNNRLNENTRQRTNANRLFDSQNNNRGGYNVGPQPMYYYAGSHLQLEWTNQHSCGAENNGCELIIQYMCADTVRDGTTTNKIKLSKTGCTNQDCDSDEQYGMHENYEHYWRCKTRERNKGLFTADQNMAGNNRKTATTTRQENNGNNENNRYGYECTEERDYYPYWHPSPWKDIAVLTNDVKRCQYYQTESANVKERWYCDFPKDKLETSGLLVPNNEEDCKNFESGGVKGRWKRVPPHGIPAPVCRESQVSRDNHLGNGLDGNANRYNWTLPDINGKKCVIRMRYNITTDDYDGWRTNASMNADNANKPTKLDLSTKFGFDNFTAAEKRGYVFEGNPEVKIFDEGDFNLQLAVDTSQFARTFQDRSHVFTIKKRPDNLKGATIHNLNVRGKRGNIVQVYPAVEYDFAPTVLEMMPGDYVHFQWTGSDTNPNNNDGQGKLGSDRNNVLLLQSQHYPEGTGMQYGPAPTYGHWGNNYPTALNQSQFLGLNKQQLTKLAFLDPGKVGVNLDEASPYFDLGPQKVTQLGTYHYVCTRNNDFTNRDQKGRLMVTNVPFSEKPLGYEGGNIQLPHGAGSVQVAPGVFSGLTMMRLELWSQANGHQRVENTGKTLKAGEDYASDFLVVYPQSSLTLPDKSVSVTLKVDPDASNVAVYRTSSENAFATWTKLDTDVDGDKAHFHVTQGGVYVAKSHSYTVIIVALFISMIVFVIILVGGICYCKKNDFSWKKLKNDAAHAKKGLGNTV